jgi:hypothetical protein
MRSRQKYKVPRLKMIEKTDSQNPVPESGYRNLFCVHYSQCLDFAILSAWDTWACSRCTNKKQVQVFDDFPASNRDAALYHELPGEFHKLAS